MKIFNHVQIKVKDLGRSRKFYGPVMAALGYKMVLEIEGIVIGYGTSAHDMFEIRQFDKKSPLSEHVHLAFNASCKEDVDAFYKSALAFKVNHVLSKDTFLFLARTFLCSRRAVNI